MTDKEQENKELEAFEIEPVGTKEEHLEPNKLEIIEDQPVIDDMNSEEAAILLSNHNTQNIQHLQDTTNPDSHMNVPPSNNGSKLWMGLSLLLAVILVIVLIKPPFANNGGNEAVATVNGTEITKDTLYDQLVKLGGPQTLDNLITEELIEQEVTKSKVTVTEADVTQELDTIKKNFGTEEEFNAALTQMGMTLENLKEEMQIQVKIRKLVEPQVKVTDEDIKAYYETNKASFGDATLEKSTADIKEMLTTQQLSELSSKWIADLKTNADIKNTLKTEEAPVTDKVPADAPVK